MITLLDTYQVRYNGFLAPVAKKLEIHLRGCFESLERIDRICARAKNVERFVQKAMKQENRKPKYNDPLSQIQDQIGARIVTFYTSDVTRVADEVRRYFRPIEEQELVPDTESEFGYIGLHFILLLPTDILDGIDEQDVEPKFFELQIKTLFQHAWSEAEHDLGYKATTDLTSHQKRKIAFTAAQAWGADQMFNDLFHELSSLPVKDKSLPESNLVS